jgi:hypothetical protein
LSDQWRWIRCSIWASAAFTLEGSAPCAVHAPNVAPAHLPIDLGSHVGIFLLYFARKVRQCVSLGVFGVGLVEHLISWSEPLLSVNRLYVNTQQIIEGQCATAQLSWTADAHAAEESQSADLTIG